MAEPQPARRRARVTIEATIEITDPKALERAALADIDQTVFASDDDTAAEEIRRAEAAEVRDDPLAALRWLVDPNAVVDDVDGIEFVEGTVQVVPLEADDQITGSGPDFTALFPVCRCDEDSCGTCSGFRLTPRTAAVTWSAARTLSRAANDDIAEHGDDPVTTDRNDEGWKVLHRYPPITFRQNAVWRRQAARTFDDLAGDLASGQWPRPRCVAEEMALHLILSDAEVSLHGEWDTLPANLDDLPEHPDDYDWHTWGWATLPDVGVLQLFLPPLENIEVPDSDQLRGADTGDLRPRAWFRPSDSAGPRDGRR